MKKLINEERKNHVLMKICIFLESHQVKANAIPKLTIVIPTHMLSNKFQLLVCKKLNMNVD